MILLTLVVLGLGIGLASNRRNPEDAAFFGFFGFFLGGLIGTIASCIVSDALSEHPWELESDVRIASWREGDGVQGRFALGSGIVDNGKLLIAYHTRQDSSFFPQRIIAEVGQVEIVEDSIVRPHIETLKTITVVSPTAKWLAFPFGYKGDGVPRRYYKFYVPIGTIRDRI